MVDLPFVIEHQPCYTKPLTYNYCSILTSYKIQINIFEKRQW